jgi:predicted lipoprotein with Yx(FWY)xxD motif
VETVPTPEMAEQLQADLLVTVVLNNENANITVNEGFWAASINTQFQASVTVNFMDDDGQTLYNYAANGAGFGNRSGSCSEIAPALKTSMDSAMKQIADYIAQSTFGASLIRDYEKAVLLKRAE